MPFKIIHFFIFSLFFFFLLAKPKPGPEIGCEIALFEGLAFENDLKACHFSFYSIYLFICLFILISEINLCLDRQPVYCSRHDSIEMTLAMYGADQPESLKSWT